MGRKLKILACILVLRFACVPSVLILTFMTIGIGVWHRTRRNVESSSHIKVTSIHLVNYLTKSLTKQYNAITNFLLL